MKAAVFVSRDGDEFNKYIDSLVSDGGGYVHTKDFSGPLIGADAVCCDEFEVEIISRYIKDLSLLILVVNRNGVNCFEACKNLQCLNQKAVKEVRTHIMSIVSACVRVCVGDNNNGNCCDVEIQTFIHWGGGTPLDFEKNFRETYLSLLPVSEETNGAIKSFSAFSYSTRLPERLDVSGEKIRLPESQDEWDRLVSRFSYDIFKDELSKCVWEAFGRTSAQEMPKQDTSSDDKRKVKKGYINRWLRGVAKDGDKFQAINDYMNKWLDHLNVVCDANDQWRVRALLALKRMVDGCDGDENNQDEKVGEQIVALFAEVIERKGVYV